mgnify:CR=1 FL=1
MRKLTKKLQKRTKHCKQSTVFSASACNGSNNGSGVGSGSSTVQAAEKEKNLTIHFMMPSNWVGQRRQYSSGEEQQQ